MAHCRNKVLGWLWIIIVLWAAFAAWFIQRRGYDSQEDAQTKGGSFQHEVYIWQRHWGDDLEAAIEQASGEVAGYTVLAAEVAWEGDKPRTVRPAVDYESLRATGRCVGLALRIGPFQGRYSHEAVMTFLSELAHSTVGAARDAGVEPVEFQIDFDCAESKLDSYRTWVEALKRELAPLPVVITVLPCWLDHKAFVRLAGASDGYILQVHSLDRPTHADASIVLCDPDKALQWVEQAGRIGVPFRVALPTYGYTVFFNKDGEFAALAAEGPAKTLPHVRLTRQARADPYAMAGLVRKWGQARPSAMTGVIWYRLPVETDRLNWSWITLSTVMKGLDPVRHLAAEVEYPQPRLADIVLVNAGQVDEPADVTVCMDFGLAAYVAGDGLAGFNMVETGSGLQLRYGASVDSPAMIKPGARWKIGWVRFKDETVVSPVVQPARTNQPGEM